MEINKVLQKDFVRNLIVQVCGHDIEIIKRQKCFVIRNKIENDHDNHRIILLPPNGYTANSLSQMNSHDEADFATIQVKGTVRDEKNGFSKLKDCLLVASIHENGTASNLSQPYLTFKIQGDLNPDLVKRLYSSGTTPFYVVKNNGYGFYHNLINITDEWLVLKLHKRLRLQKSVDLSPYLQLMPTQDGKVFQNLYQAVQKVGDKLFQKEPELVEKILQIPLNISLPILSEMLYIHDTGKHEACTIFAVLLKLGKQSPDIVMPFLEEMRDKEQVPTYYVGQLLQKISSHQAQQTNTIIA